MQGPMKDSISGGQGESALFIYKHYHKKAPNQKIQCNHIKGFRILNSNFLYLDKTYNTS